MTIEDYQSVFDLWQQSKMVGLCSLDVSYEGIYKFLKRNPSSNFVALIDDQLVGAIMSGHDGRRGFIYHLVVAQDHSRQGIGRELVFKCLEALEKEEITKVAIVVFKNNENCNAFWQHLGFELRDDLVYRNISINQENN